jgi:putative membrane protein
MLINRLLAVGLAAALTIACGGRPDTNEERAREGQPGATTPAERTGAAPGATGTVGSATRAGGVALSAEDREFAETVSMSNQAEITLGQLAEDRASNERVKALGGRIADDHEKASQNLRDAVGGSDVALASQPKPEDEQVKKRLEGMKGAAFDRAFLEEMVTRHEKAVAAFEKASKSSNEAIRSFAERTLPTVKSHLEEARQLQGGTTRY